MKDSRMQAWGKIRKMGRTRYILLYWVVAMGLTTSILWAIIMTFVWKEGSFLLNLIPAIVVIPISGYFAGALFWRSAEKEYEEAHPEKVP